MPSSSMRLLTRGSTAAHEEHLAVVHNVIKGRRDEVDNRRSVDHSSALRGELYILFFAELGEVDVKARRRICERRGAGISGWKVART